MVITPILTDAASRRDAVREKAVEGLKAAFPLKLRDQTLELHDVHVVHQSFGPTDQKQAILQGTSLQEPVKGTVVLKDAAGREVERVKNFTLLHLPYMTERHTFIVAGNEYQVANQVRMKPGVYARKRANEELEAAFNLAKGSNFRLSLDPVKGHPLMEYASTTIPLYPVLRQLGVPHQDVARAWGTEVAETNRAAFDKKHEVAVEKLYKKLIHPAKQTHTTHETRLDAVREAYGQTVMDPEVNRDTLGHPHEKVTPLALLDASKKLLSIYKSDADTDDRDSLAFKTFHSVDDFVKERIALDARSLANKVKLRATNKTSIRDILPPAPFTTGIKGFLAGSQLSAIPTQINPMEMIDHSVKVTSLGEGGISSDRAVPLEARQLHHTHLGIFDTSRTPESFNAGIDIRTAMETHRDEKGNLYAILKDRKTGKTGPVTVRTISRSVVAFPGQPKSGMVSVMKDGQVQRVASSEVDFELLTSGQLFSPSTNLVPFIESSQGNRITMGSKMQTQALPLLHREVPLVQAGAKQVLANGDVRHTSFEKLLGKLTVPVAPVSGTVVKVDSQYIYIDPTGKHASQAAVDLPAVHAREFARLQKLNPATHTTGSFATGLTVPGKSDLDFAFPVQDIPGESRRLAAAGIPFHKNRGTYHQHAYQTPEGVWVDVNVRSHAESNKLKEGLARLRSLPEAERARIQSMKTQLQNDPEAYKNFKYKLYEEHGVIPPGGDWEAWGSTKLSAAVKRQKTINGLTLKIELEKGDERKGVSPEGKAWSKTMALCYGHIPKTTGDDGETVDVYLKEDGAFDTVYVVHQRKKDGSHDEDKCMLGFDSKDSAKEAYQQHGPEWGFGSLTEYSWDEFLDDYIAERRKEAAEKSTLVKVPYDTHFPFASKTSLHHTVMVKPGDHVKADQVLADSNYTREGELALGKNMSVAYLAYYGMNSNDAVVISEGAAKKLTSEHVYKEIIDVDPDTTLGREVHRQYYGSKYTAAQYEKLSALGVVKKGQKVLPHDPLIVGVVKTKLSASDVLLSNLKKSLVKPYKELARLWEHDFEGEVLDVYESEKRVVVVVRTYEPMRVGDKLSGRHGNKGVIGQIVPDHKMIQDEKGAPIDVLYTSAGVISRINPAQIIETAVAKVADKTGKPIEVESFSGRDNVAWAKALLKEHGVKDKETVFDPISGKRIPDILVGKQYTFRLFKTTDSNFSARDAGGGYDINQQPTKGGVEGAKGIGNMEFNALVAHNARNFLRESAALKSQKNDEFWRALQLGLPLPAMKTPFAFNKFTSMMQASGVRVDQRGSKISLQPLTDNDVLRMSSGAIQNEKLVRAKDLAPERGGFFDPALTGGDQGTRWTHINLAEPVVNPVFAEPVRRLMGMTNKQFDEAHFKKGGAYFKQQLNDINVESRLKELHADLKKAPASKVDDLVKQIKYLESLKRVNLRPGDAYVLTKLPVIPPVMRPILPGNGGQELVVGDSNLLYQTAMLHNKTLMSQVETKLLPPDEHAKLRENLHNAIGAVIGTNDTDNQKLQKRNVKGFLEHLTGKTTPKCYDAATDILTEHGWVPFPAYDGKAKVATVNLGTHAFEWQAPVHATAEHYSGPMIHTQSREIDLLVTPNHQHVVSVRRKRVDGDVWLPWEKVDSTNFLVSDRKRVMVSAEHWKGQAPALEFDGVEVTALDAFAEFVGWWVSEGWLQHGGAAAILCQAATSPHVATVDACFSRLGIPFIRSVYTRKGGYQAIWWKIKSPALGRWLRENCGEGAKQKFLSQAILSWPAPMLLSVLKGYVLGDGSLHKDKTAASERKTRKRRKALASHFCTTSTRLIDSLQELCAKTGYQAILRKEHPPVNERCQPIFTGSIRGFSDVTIESAAFTREVPFDGLVYCVTVPNGTLVVRRGGKPAVSGNSSFFHQKLLMRKQDLSARGTAAPDGSLGIDDVGLPEDMMWEIFGKFVINRLVRRGFGALQAKEMLEKRHPAARDALLAEAKERPVILNRAPTLHRYGMIGAFATPVTGKTIRVNPAIEKGMNLDFDGDTLQIHTPVLPGAVDDVKRMTISKLVFSDAKPDDLMYGPRMEAALGLYHATAAASGAKTKHFKTKADAVAAYKRGEVKLTDTVEIG